MPATSPFLPFPCRRLTPYVAEGATSRILCRPIRLHLIERCLLRLTEKTWQVGMKTFPQKAARFSLLAPALMLALNVVTAAAVKGLPASTLVVGAISAVMIIAGLVASVLALAGIAKHGRTGILWPALIGLTLNALVAAGVILVFVVASRGGLPTLDDLALKRQITGDWVRDGNGDKMSLKLRADGTFHFFVSVDGGADFSGTWAVQNRWLHLNVENIVEGNRERIGNLIRWTIDQADPNELSLGAAKGQDRYARGVIPD